MASFDYGNFSDGWWDIEFAAHAKKYTKEETLKLFSIENDFLYSGEGYRKPTLNDIKERAVRYYPYPPGEVELEFGNGCYSYARKGSRGSFPVWVIYVEDLEVEEDE